MADADNLEALVEEWSQITGTQNWDQALDICVKGYRLAARDKDHVHMMMFLGFLRITAESLFDKHAQRKKKPDILACSFCAKEQKEVKLVAGAGGVAICADCARLAAEL